jgi:Bacterial SH3 domain
MKKIIVSVAAIFLSFVSFSQFTYYAAAKAGLSMREQPNTSAKVLEKIAYGEKLVTVADENQQVAIATEGFNSFWWKVKYNNKTGYIVNSYVLPTPPPKAGVKTFSDYFSQVSTKAGSPLLIKKSGAALNEMGESTITKQLFKNGMEWQEEKGYENGSNLYLLPDFTIEQCFLLVRLLGQYPDLISEKDLFPVKNTNTKIEGGTKSVEVQREKYDGKPGPVQKIKIVLEQGAITEFEIFILGTQAVIFWTSGV